MLCANNGKSTLRLNNSKSMLRLNQGLILNSFSLLALGNNLVELLLSDYSLIQCHSVWRKYYFKGK